MTTGQRPVWRPKNNFAILLLDLWRRTIRPLGNVSFLGGLICTAFFGGWAIWIELVGMNLGVAHHDVESLQAAMVTFFPAIVGTTFMQLQLDDDCDKRLKTISILFLVGVLAAALYLAFVPASSVTRRIRILVPLCVFAVWFWGIANARTPTYQDEPEAATGGDPTTAIDGDLGDLKG